MFMVNVGIPYTDPMGHRLKISTSLLVSLQLRLSEGMCGNMDNHRTSWQKTPFQRDRHTRHLFARGKKKKQSWAAKKIQTWALQSEDLIWPFVFSLAIFLTPLKINMEPKHHAIEQENHLPTLHDFGLQPLIFQLVSNFKIWSMPWNDVLFFPSPNIAPEKIGLED